MPCLEASRTLHQGIITTRTKTNIEACKPLSSKLFDEVIDLAPILNNLDAKMDELVNLPNKNSLMETLRELNGSKGGGLKLFDKLAGTLTGIGQAAMDGETFVNIRKGIVDVRQKARVLVTTRAACVLIPTALH